MANYIVDILSPYINFDCVPNEENVILLVPENFIVTQEIKAKFSASKNIKSALLEGCHYYRVTSELERGAIVGIIACGTPNLVLCTSRIEIFEKIISKIDYANYVEKWITHNQKYLDSIEVNLPLKRPRNDIDYQTVFKNKYLDSLYTHILRNYVDKFLKVQNTRAIKITSAKAQLKNLAKGAVSSALNSDRVTKHDLPNEVELTEIIFDDLLSHGITEDQFPYLIYNDIAINDFFGRKTKEFIPKYKLIRNRTSYVDEDVEKIEENKTLEIWNDIIIEVKNQNPKNIQELAGIINDWLVANQPNGSEIPDYTQEELVQKTIKGMFAMGHIALVVNNSESRYTAIADNYKQHLSEKINA